jgi:ABC-type transporter Mla subunit MlaD
MNPLIARRWTRGRLPATAALLFALAACRPGLPDAEALHVLTPNAAGVTEGMPVKIHGVVVGKVTAIELLPPAPAGAPEVKVDLGIDAASMKFIPKGSTARVAQENLIGERTVELIPPADSSSPVARDDVLAFEHGKDLMDIAQQAQGALMPLIASANAFTESLSRPDAPFQQMLKANQEFLSGMPNVAEHTVDILSQTQQSVKAIEKEAVATLQKASHTIGLVEQAGPALLDKMDKAAANAQQATQQLNAISGQAAEQLPGILDEAKAAATQSNQMVSNARQTWPISMLTGTATTPQSLPTDSIGGLPLPSAAP